MANFHSCRNVNLRKTATQLALQTYRFCRKTERWPPLYYYAGVKLNTKIWA